MSINLKQLHYRDFEAHPLQSRIEIAKEAIAFVENDSNLKADRSRIMAFLQAIALLNQECDAIAVIKKALATWAGTA